jgi:hypothetical protein
MSTQERADAHMDLAIARSADRAGECPVCGTRWSNAIYMLRHFRESNEPQKALESDTDSVV